MAYWSIPSNRLPTTSTKQFHVTAAKTVEMPFVEAAPQPMAVSKIVGIIVSVIVGVLAGAIAILHLAYHYTYPEWLLLPALILSALFLISIFIGIIASACYSGGFFDFWMLGELLEVILKLIFYIVYIIVEIVAHAK
jgi:hypothetical protein